MHLHYIAAPFTNTRPLVQKEAFHTQRLTASKDAPSPKGKIPEFSRKKIQ